MYAEGVEVTQGELMAKECDPGNIQSCSQFQDSTKRQILPWCKLFKLVFDQKILTAFHLTRILLSLKENQGRMAYKSVKPLRVKTTQKQTKILTNQKQRKTSPTQ